MVTDMRGKIPLNARKSNVKIRNVTNLKLLGSYKANLSSTGCYLTQVTGRQLPYHPVSAQMDNLKRNGGQSSAPDPGARLVPRFTATSPRFHTSPCYIESMQRFAPAGISHDACRVSFRMGGRTIGLGFEGLEALFSCDEGLLGV